ncbi:MAG: hypothetical protein AB1486_15510 [Planctomycetota bacterium]
MARAKLTAVLDALELVYGKVKFLPKEPLLDQAIFLVFREGWDYKKAARALRILQSEFVDWNEARVSTVGEICNLLGFGSDRNFAEKSQRVLSLLDKIYRERSVVTLDHVLEMDPEARRQYLASLEVLSPADVQLLLQLHAPPGELLMTYQALRVGSRIGLIPKTTSIPLGTRHYAAILPESDWPRLQVLMVQHGDAVCQSRHFRCEACRLTEHCKSARVVKEEKAE